jgi:hypothetical protein
MQRRSLTAILVLTLLASSWAAFGPWVMAGAAGYLTVLSVMRRRRATWGMGGKAIISGAFALPVVAALLWLYVSEMREQGRREICGNHIKQVALALLNYHDCEKCFPPPCLFDANGAPMHSWRVLIVPYFCMRSPESHGYDFKKPWNSPGNLLVAPEFFEAVWKCPTAEGSGVSGRFTTDYVLVTGPNTALTRKGTPDSRRNASVPPDAVLLVEVANSDIHWMEPRDMSLDDLAATQADGCRPLTSHHVESSYWHEWEPAAGNIVCGDASVHFLPGPISPEDARTLLTANDGQGFNVAAFAKQMPPAGRLRWDHVVGLPVFCFSLVALLVLALTHRRRESREDAGPVTVETHGVLPRNGV